jgi:hypothetical protein
MVNIWLIFLSMAGDYRHLAISTLLITYVLFPSLALDSNKSLVCIMIPFCNPILP